MQTKSFFLFFFLVLLLITSCTSSQKEQKVITIEKEVNKNPGSSFLVKEDAEVCTHDGKPIIRKFATTWCPHCKWVKGIYTKVVNEYVEQDKIIAYLWNLDKNDDALTTKKETTIPATEHTIHKEFNEQQGIPTFVFGCKYYRIGNAFEKENNVAAEEAEFRAVIEKVLADIKQ